MAPWKRHTDHLLLQLCFKGFTHPFPPFLQLVHKTSKNTVYFVIRHAATFCNGASRSSIAILLQAKNAPKGVSDYPKLYHTKQAHLKRSRKGVGMEFLITPSCAEQGKNTPKGVLDYTEEKNEKASFWKAQTTHTTMTSYDKRVCNIHAFKKIPNKLTHNTEKIRNTYSKAAHTGSASTWDITIVQCPNMLTQKWKLSTEPHMTKSAPEHCRLLDKSFSKSQFQTNRRLRAILQQVFKAKSSRTAAITSQLSTATPSTTITKLLLRD